MIAADADRRAVDQPVVGAGLLVEIEPLQPPVAGIDRAEPAHVVGRVDADPLIAHALAERIVGLGDRIVGGALRQRRIGEEQERRRR